MFRREMARVKAGSDIIFVILVLVPFITFVEATENSIHLKFSTAFPKTTTYGPPTIDFCQRLEKASGGKVKIDIYWAGALGPAKEQLDVVRGGLADMAHNYPVWHPASFPLSLFVELPLFAPSSQSATEIISELIKRDLITNEFKQAGVEPLVTLSWPPSQLYSNKKISRVEDFKGVRIWSMGPIMAKTFALVGASGLSLTWADIYMGMERGTVDAVPCSWSSSVNLKLQEVAKHPINIGFMGGYLGTFIMNKASWNKLPPDLQAKWKKIGTEFSNDYAKILDDLEVEKRQVWEKHGREVIEFPLAEKKKLARNLVVVWQEWMDARKKEGKGKLAQEIYKTYVDVMEKRGETVLVKIPGL